MAVPGKDKGFVILQFLLFAAFLWDIESLQVILPESLRWIALFGGFVGFILLLTAIFQLRHQLSAFPSPTANSQLKIGGAFAFSRHPIYSGIIFMLFAAGFWMESGYKIILSLLCFLLFYYKSRYEEERLQERFPEYASYKKATGRFFPKFRGRI